jgi:hypothetical protein
MTLVEVLIAVVLVGATTTAIYSGGFFCYKVMMRSRARLEAQGIAFDRLWLIFNMTYEDLPTVSVSESLPTPEESLFSTNGLVVYALIPETEVPVSRIDYWEVRVQVWAPQDSPLFAVIEPDGTVSAEYPDPLVDYSVLRYRGRR